MQRLSLSSLSGLLGLALMLYAGASRSKAPDHSCATIEWNPQFLQSYPTAPAACRRVVESAALEYAEFKGRVSRVDHDVVQVDVLNTAGTSISNVAFLMGQDGHVVMDRRGKTIDRLTLGDKLTFWVREGQFGVSPTLKAHPMLLVTPESVEALIENLGLPQHFIDLR